MITINSIDKWHMYRNHISEALKIGFIPTMGCLHEGHISLIKESNKHNEITVVSVFVNPIQFNDQKDYKNYPRDKNKDLDLLRTQKVDCVFIPTENNFCVNDEFKIKSNHPLSLELEGKSRPGHFDGVLTVVLKLLLLINPHNAYFGEKDYQQYKLISEMKKAFFLKANIIKCPTIRKEDGLPLSSRNENLSQYGKEQAKFFSEIFYQELSDMRSIQELYDKLQNSGIQVEYLRKVDNRIFIAVQIEGIRIIDNVFLKDAYKFNEGLK